MAEPLSRDEITLMRTFGAREDGADLYADTMIAYLDRAEKAEQELADLKTGVAGNGAIQRAAAWLNLVAAMERAGITWQRELGTGEQQVIGTFLALHKAEQEVAALRLRVAELRKLAFNAIDCARRAHVEIEHNMSDGRLVGMSLIYKARVRDLRAQYDTLNPEQP